MGIEGHPRRNPFEDAPGQRQKEMTQRTCHHCAGRGKDAKGEECRPCKGTGKRRDG